MGSISDLVPNRTLCRKLPKKDFKNSTFVWFRINGDIFKDPYWVLETRERLNSLQVKLEYEIWFPAPSAEDFWEKLPEGTYVFIDKSKRPYTAAYTDVIATGKTCAEALAKLYIKLKKEKML